jgi:hypothetical protein
MNRLRSFFTETCPVCDEPLTTSSSNVLCSHIVKSCPHGHYEKELHPALDIHVEHGKS